MTDDGPAETREAAALRGRSVSDLRDVGAWLVREADKRVEFFPQRRDGVDDLMRDLAAALFRAALAASPPAPGEGTDRGGS